MPPEWNNSFCFVAVFQPLSHIWLFTTLWTATHRVPLSIVSWSLLSFMSTESVKLTISSSVASFFFCLQSFPARVMSWLITSGGQSTEASVSASVLQINIQGWLPLGLTALISWQFKRLSRVFYRTTIQKHQFFSAQPSLWSNTHNHTWQLEKPLLLLHIPLLTKRCLCLLIYSLGLS